MKATPDEYAFHQRMISLDDKEVFEELASAMYYHLVHDMFQRVRGSHLSFNPHLLEEAVGQALLDYNDNPDHYSPERSTLRSYLGRMAYNRLRDAWKKEHRHAEHLKPFSQLSYSETEQELATDAAEVENYIDAKELIEQLDVVFPDPTERSLVTLIVNRVRSPDLYIHVLKLHHLSKCEQRKEIKRARERIVKRMRRLRILFQDHS